MPDEPLLPSLRTPLDLKGLARAELPRVAQEIRDAICEQVSRTGGHFAPNLGVVELTLALHYVFDLGHDRLLFDVGHQCYPHKLLTGRQHLFAKLRQAEGMAGFPEPRESEHDLFSVGHAGTAISTAVGMARGDALLGEKDRRVVALVGDASIVNGVALEGLNNAGTLQRQFLVVLNDNGMSIAKPQGALAKSFDRIRVNARYGTFKKRARRVLKKLPGGETLEELYHRASEALKALLYPDHFFSQFGLVCIGPVDGHDLDALVDVLEEIKDFDRPVLLHCKTVKGKGFDFSSGDPTTFHSPKPFTIAGCRVELAKGGRSFTSAYADAMADLMRRDERVFAVTAAMPDGTGVAKLLAEFPERTLDTGICESHAMDMCAGMAKAGLKPFFAVYSTFVQRALDQVFQEVALQGLPVRVCMDRAGYVGGDGAVHHGFLDVSLFKPFPGTVLLAASDEPNLVAALEFQRSWDAGASFLRYPRANVREHPVQDEVPPFVPGRANLARAQRGAVPELAVLAYGTEVYEALAALELPELEGYDVAVWDARFAKPVDLELVRSLVLSGVPILTVEDHSTINGFGTAVLEACNEARVSADGIHRLGMPEAWIHQDSRSNQLARTGLDAAGIARRILLILAELEVVPAPSEPARPARNGRAAALRPVRRPSSKPPAAGPPPRGGSASRPATKG
jgi:1-deoxy-D-xylulose-5-phosphate synthase